MFFSRTLTCRACQALSSISVVRRRFPAIPVIAMSGSFASSRVPDGVAAGGFLQKGCGIDLLLKTLAAVCQKNELTREERPIWISPNGHDSSGEPFVTMVCPECLRGFSLAVSDPINHIDETNCIYCGVSIQYGIATSCV